MAQDNQIDVTIYPSNLTLELADDPIEFHDVNYISFVSDETYGIPALIAEERVKNDGLPAKILYVFPANIVAMEAERKA